MVTCDFSLDKRLVAFHATSRMDGYTKLHAKILMSSIWNEPKEVRLLWITMLAMSDHQGMIEGAVSGLAHMARLTPEETQHAIDVLSGPDPQTSDGTTGERIRQVAPGIWHVINHARYRDRKTRKQVADMLRMRALRAEVATDATDATCSNVTPCRTESRGSVYVYSESTEGAAVQNSGQSVPRNKAASRPDDVSQQVWDDFLALRRAKKAPLSVTALARLRTEAGKARLSLSEVIEICCQNGWQSFQARYMANGLVQDANQGASHAIPTTRHNSALDLGDPACDCQSCRAQRRDQGAQSSR